MTAHAAILAYMFSLVEQHKIKVKFSEKLENNLLFVQLHVGNLLKTEFNHLQELVCSFIK